MVLDSTNPEITATITLDRVSSVTAEYFAGPNYGRVSGGAARIVRFLLKYLRLKPKLTIARYGMR
jgi:hypothetical protein